ncbi:hypothetical protein MPER_04317 [Moniliophthora perniciosa FA553]|nr:hypothetical protein MPER_04317 [Moniliophthora perniciosa FA553]
MLEDSESESDASTEHGTLIWYIASGLSYLYERKIVHADLKESISLVIIATTDAMIITSTYLASSAGQLQELFVAAGTKCQLGSTWGSSVDDNVHVYVSKIRL